MHGCIAPGPITRSCSLVTSPCLCQTGNFPQSRPFSSTDTTSTLSASWSQWSLVMSFLVAVGFGIWLDWPTSTTLLDVVLEATVWNLDAGAIRPLLSEVYKSVAILSMSIFVPLPCTQTVIKFIRARTMSAQCLHNVCTFHVHTIRILYSLSFVGRMSWTTLYQANLVAPGTGASPQVFQYYRPGCLWP